MTPKKHSRQFSPTHTKTRQLRIAVIIVILVVVFAVPKVRSALRHGVSFIGLGIAQGTHSVGGFFGSVATAVRNKETLQNQNTALKAQVDQLTAQLATSTQLSQENADLKSAMNRTSTANFTLAAVISKPPHSMYDTIIIDGGSKNGFVTGQVVYADGQNPIGTIDQVLPTSAIVRLYSAPGQQTDARLSPSNIDVTIVGRGGGDFSATVPRDLVVTDGATVVTKDIDQSVLAVYKKITSDSRDPFQTLLLVSPINVNGLAFVEVRQN